MHSYSNTYLFSSEKTFWIFYPFKLDTTEPNLQETKAHSKKISQHDPNYRKKKKSI